MRPVLKLAIKLAVLLISVPVIISLAVRFFPMHVLDGEYAAYYQNGEYARENGSYCRVLIMGDSTAKSALKPDLLTADAYNYAIGGACPIEEYYCLREYLEQHEAPEILFYMSAINTMSQQDAFWTRTMHFHRLRSEDIADMEKRLTAFEDLSALDVSNVEEFAQEAKLYQLYAPQKYSVVFLKSLLENLIGGSRYKQNRELYETVVENEGHMFFGTAESWDKINHKVPALSDFDDNGIAAYYFSELIKLCEENGIRFVFQSPPYNSSQKPAFHDSVIKKYLAYMDRVQKDCPDTTIHAEITWYEPECFGDPAHLNRSGLTRFTQVMKERYPEIFRS